MIPLCTTLYLLVSFGILYVVEGGILTYTYCNYIKKSKDWPYEETITQTCLTSCCEKDCCPTTDIQIWTWVVCAASPIIIISVIIVIIICCKRNKTKSHSPALPRTYVPPPRRITEIQCDDLAAHSSAQSSLNSITQASSNDSSNNIYSYDQNGDHLVLPSRRGTEIHLKNDDFAAHSSVQAALDSITQMRSNDSSKNIYSYDQNDHMI